MAPYAGTYLLLDGYSLHDTILDPQPLAISKSDFPEPLRLAPDGPQPPGPLSQIRLVVPDTHVDDVVVAAPRQSPARLPGHGCDDELHGLEATLVRGVIDVAHAKQPIAEALDELARAGLAGPEGEARLHAGSNARDEKTVDAARYRRLRASSATSAHATPNGRYPAYPSSGISKIDNP
jgi:hypothetical protein